MPTRPPDVDPALLRALLRRLSELEGEANGVTDIVLGHLPEPGPGLAETTVTEVSSGLVGSFSTLADSVAQTRRIVATGRHRYVDVDLTVVRDLDEVVQ